MNYQILSKLSEGGFSEVFEVRDPASALDEVLILKRLNPEMSRRPDVRRAFTREGEILSALRHPNVVTFRRCYYEGDRICLVMEKVDGRTLDVWLREHRPDAEEALDAFRQILEAVDYLHHRATPLLHLDLKPENVLITPSPDGVRPVLIDFGIARDLGHGGLEAYTPPYAAPEQVRGGELGCFTDVYALGQILAEILQHFAAGLGTGERTNLEAVSARAREPSRRRRYGDAGEMLRAFRQARHEDRVATGSAASGGSVFSGAPRWLPWGLGGLGLAAALVVLLFLFLLPGEREDPPDVATPETAAPETEPGVGTLPETVAGSPYEGTGCWRSVATTADPEAMARRFDRCARIALDNPDREEITHHYLAAEAFVDQQSGDLDARSRRVLESRLESFRLNIEQRVRASR